MTCSNDHIWSLKLPANKRLILLAMFENSKDNTSEASMGYVAWQTGYCERQVRRVIKKMADDGLLTLEKRPGKTGLYTLNPTAGEQKEPYTPKRNRVGQNVRTDIMSALPRTSMDVRTTPDIMSPNNNNYIYSAPGLESAQQAAEKYKIKGMSDDALMAACEKHGGHIVENAMQIAAMKGRPDWLYVVGIMENFEKRVNTPGSHSKVTYEGWTPSFVEPGAEQNLRIVEELMQQQKDAANA